MKKFTTTKEEERLYDMIAQIGSFALNHEEDAAERLRRSARRRARRYLARNPTARAWIILGDLTVNDKKREECYQNALSIDDTETEANYELAWMYYCYFDEYQHQRAEKTLQPAIESPPEFLESDVFHLASKIYAALGNRRLAYNMRRRSEQWERRRRQSRRS